MKRKGGRNHGAVLLSRTGQSQDSIALELGVSRVAVSLWMRGASRPSSRPAAGRERSAREVLAERYGIPVSAWDEEPPKKAPASTSSTAAKLSPAPEAPAPARPAAPDDALALADELMGDVQRGIRELREDPEALPLEKARVLASLGQTLAVVAKVTGAFDLGSRIFRLPIWKEIEAALSRGLAGHPEAAAAVARELRRTEAEAGYKRH